MNPRSHSTHSTLIFPVPARTFSSKPYLYGIQGQEKDDATQRVVSLWLKIKGEGLSINYKYRMHDPRVGRFFSVDPLAPEYPWNSPYAFSENSVIDAVELEGLESMLVPEKDKKEEDKPKINNTPWWGKPKPINQERYNNLKEEFVKAYEKYIKWERESGEPDENPYLEKAPKGDNVKGQFSEEKGRFDEWNRLVEKWGWGKYKPKEEPDTTVRVKSQDVYGNKEKEITIIDEDGELTEYTEKEFERLIENSKE